MKRIYISDNNKRKIDYLKLKYNKVGPDAVLTLLLEWFLTDEDLETLKTFAGSD